MSEGCHPVTGALPTCIGCLGIIRGRGTGALRCVVCYDDHLKLLGQESGKRSRARAAAKRAGKPVPDWAKKRKDWSKR